MSWDEMVAEYIERYAVTHSPNTVNVTRLQLRYLQEFCQRSERNRPADVTPSDIAAYQQSLRWEPGFSGRLTSEAGLALKMEIARRFFRWAAQRFYVLLDPTLNLVVRRVTTLGRVVLTTSEVESLLNAATQTVIGMRDRALAEMLYGTGIRRAECHALNLDAVDLRGGVLTVVRGKGGPGRVVPMGDQLAAVLRVYLEKSRPELYPHVGENAFFLSQLGLRLGYEAIAAVVRTLGQRAGLPRPVAPHDLRHALGTHLVAAGADVRIVQEMLGHRTIATTERYARLRQKDVFEAFYAYHPRETMDGMWVE